MSPMILLRYGIRARRWSPLLQRESRASPGMSSSRRPGTQRAPRVILCFDGAGLWWAGDRAGCDRDGPALRWSARSAEVREGNSVEPPPSPADRKPPRENRPFPLRLDRWQRIIEHVYDIHKAELRFGLYRHATTDLEREVAGACDEQYEDDLMRRLTASRRVMGYAEALRLLDLAEFAAARPSTKPGEQFHEWTADEISLAMGWTRNMAFAQLHLATTVTQRLPGTLTALSRGDLDLRGVKALADITDPLDAAKAKAVEDAVLPKAAKQNTTELRRAARRAVLRLDPAGAQQRHEKRKQQRRVELAPLDDAMAELNAILPAPDATAIYHRLNDFAHATPADDTRTMDQRRADTFTDLLLGTPITTPGNTGDTTSTTNENDNPHTDSDQTKNRDTDHQNAHSDSDSDSDYSGANCGTSSGGVSTDNSSHDENTNSNHNATHDATNSHDQDTNNSHDGNAANSNQDTTSRPHDGNVTGDQDASNSNANRSGHGSGSGSGG